MLPALAPSEVGRAGDIFVEKDLRWEGRMATHANRDVSPVLVPDVKIVMVHIRPRFLPFDIADLAFPGLLHLPDRPRSAAYQNEKQTSPDLVLGEIFFGCQVFLSFRRDHNRLHPYRWSAP